MANDIDRAAVEAALKDFRDPETGRSIVQMEQLKGVESSGNRLSVTVGLTTHSAPLWSETQAEIEKLLRTKFPQVGDVVVTIVEHKRPPQKIGEIELTAKGVIAGGSGKGGVGKSTIAASLALGLARAGSKVGLMDADVYGPSIPHLLGVSGQPEVDENKRIRPVYASGLNV